MRSQRSNLLRRPFSRTRENERRLRQRHRSDGYRCGRCGARSVRLYRDYGMFLLRSELRCNACVTARDGRIEVLRLPGGTGATEGRRDGASSGVLMRHRRSAPMLRDDDRATDPAGPPDMVPGPWPDADEVTVVSARSPVVPPPPRLPVWLVDAAGVEHLVEAEP